jgi:hypothetical protein
MVDSFSTRHKIAQVIWEDAWIDPKDVMELLPVIRSTVGYVISTENEECLILSTDIYEKHPDIINTPMIIPWSAIIQWWEYDVH